MNRVQGILSALRSRTRVAANRRAHRRLADGYDDGMWPTPEETERLLQEAREGRGDAGERLLASQRERVRRMIEHTVPKLPPPPRSYPVSLT